jgi:4-carboxymuconolactone decarboxylase
MSRPPKQYRDFLERYPSVGRAYEQLADACHEAGPLTARERVLVKLGVAMGARMEGAAHAQVRKGLESGLGAEDLRHAVLLALTTAGFPTMMAARSWVEDLLSEAEDKPKAKRPGKKSKRRDGRS